VLGNRLAGAEGTGNRRRSTFGDGEQPIENALSRDERFRRCRFLLGWARRSHRPLLVHGDLLAGIELDDRLVDGVFAGLDSDDLAAIGARWHHHLVVDGDRLLDDTDDVAGRDLVAFCDLWLELPGFVEIDPGGVDPTVEKRTVHLRFQHVKWALGAVVDGIQYAGAEIDRQRLARVLDGFARADPGGLLVHLNGRDIALDLDYLAHQPFVADVDDVVHPGVEILGGHNRPTDAFDDAGFGVLLGCLTHSYSSSIRSIPMARLICPRRSPLPAPPPRVTSVGSTLVSTAFRVPRER
jgi:hypothetical protein